MAGHSQFKNIMYRKGAQDKKRARLFSKLAREITTAARQGLPDPDANPRLRTAIQTARSHNMPKDNIERAIKKSQEAGGETYEQVRYEGFGVGGVGVIVEALTDNRNRTAGEVRAIFSKHGGNLGETGAVSFMFQRTGAIEYDADVAGPETMLEAAVEAGASDVESGKNGHVLYCEPGSLSDVASALERRFGQARLSQILWRPLNTVEIDDEAAAQLMRMLEALEECDDVQNVYANFEVSDQVLAKLSA